MSKFVFRKHLSMPGLLGIVRNCFSSVREPIKARGVPLVDVLMCGLSIFSLKYKSLLQFDQDTRGGQRPAIMSNLRSLFGVGKVPSDTSLRERLDRIDPRELRPAFKEIWRVLQRGKVLQDFKVAGGYVLIALDGTRHFSSKSISGKCCGQTHHSDGTITYSHDMLGAALVHPDINVVFPLAPEMINREDGSKKNDCEHNAAKRWFADFRKDHPQLKTIILQDGLASDGPHIKTLQAHDLRFILVAKPGDHKFLFNHVDHRIDAQTYSVELANGILQEFRWVSGVPINATHLDVEVNFLECKETRKDGKTYIFTWVTDLPIPDGETARLLSGLGRARWRIENETFQTLKSSISGYEFEHNFGHGDKHLSNIFANLAVLSLLIDQVQEYCCGLFQQARRFQISKRRLWESMRQLFTLCRLSGWREFLQALGRPIEAKLLTDLEDP